MPVPAICQSRNTMLREKLGDQLKVEEKVWPMSKSLRPRSPFKLRESCATEKLYWMVPPVFELSSSDLA